MNTSKQITDRVSSCDMVKAAFEKFSPEIVSACDERFGQGFGEKVKQVIGLGVGQMEVDRNGLFNAARLLSGEREESLQATAERDRYVEIIRETLNPLRNACELVFGTGYARHVGFVGNTPTAPQKLHAFASNVLEKIKKVPVPPPAIADVAADPLAIAARIEAPVALLDQAIKTCTREQRESDHALVAKDAAVTDFDRSFRLAASTLSTWLEFSGQPELARRVRPSSRRPGNTAEVAGEVEPAEATEALEPAPAPATPAANAKVSG